MRFTRIDELGLHANASTRLDNAQNISCSYDKRIASSPKWLAAR